MSVSDGFSANSIYKNGVEAVTGAPCPGNACVASAGHTASAIGQPLHRLAEVRRQQGISVRSAARRMGVPLDQVRREEEATTDLHLSDLNRWQIALEAPLAELLVEQDSPLSGPVLNRARMLRVMKTVRAISEATREPGIGRMAKMLENQLLEIMPELKEVGAWHSVGQRRTQDEMGRIAERPVSDSFARDGLH